MTSRTDSSTADAEPDASALDDLDRELLNAVQWDFPLDPRPYAVLGERLGIPEPEVRERIATHQGRRRPPPALGDLRHARARLLSALVAAKVDPDHIDEAAAIINAASGRESQLQAQPRVQPLVHDRGAAG